MASVEGRKSKASISTKKVASLSKSSSTSAPPLGKFLASSDKPIRDKAVLSLARFLAGKKDVELPVEGGSEEEVEELEVGDLDWDNEYELDKRFQRSEMRKLWKGVYYCFWMSDKPLIQQALSSSLSLLTLTILPKSKSRQGRVPRFLSSLAYLAAFWECVVREWSALDRLRLDKFYLLVRRFVHVGFLLLRREGWDLEAVRRYNEMLCGEGGPLNVTDPKVPSSLSYHIADIYLEELNKSLTTPLTPVSTPSSTLPLIPLLQPIISSLAKAPTMTLFTRLTEGSVDPFLAAAIPKQVKKGSRITTSAVSDEFGALLSEEKIVREERAREVLKALFEEGGKKETGEVGRRRIYEYVRGWEGHQ
ncbi:Nop52-domain-containing protein [Meredithblackwellia eburnea MCA 4105]